MCGIFCSLSRHGYIAPDVNTKKLLQRRGPDSTGQHQTLIETRSSSHVHATFLSTVLALRGSTIVEQPLVDEATGSILCWNGEAWSIGGDLVVGNDSKLVLDKLLEACANGASQSTSSVVRLLSSIRGPYALVFYNARNHRIYYGRDCLGRRSLLTKTAPDGSLILSSLCDNASSDAWTEVEADGLYIVDLDLVEDEASTLTPIRVPHRRSDQVEESDLFFVGKSLGSRILLINVASALSSHE